MNRIGILLSGLALLLGCDGGRQDIFVSTASLTEAQKTAIEISDAETCNCGRVANIETTQSND